MMYRRDSLIAQLLPDVLVKGGDYALDEIHGREEVKPRRARGELAFRRRRSSTAIIDRMKK